MLMFLTLIAAGCCPARQAIPSMHDSVRVEVIERVVTVIDTIEVQLPQEQVRQIVPDSSYLETTIAASWARVNMDGTLTHSLWNLPKLWNVEIGIPTIHRDSVITRMQYREVTVEVEKPDTWWEQTQKKCFWVFLVLILARIAAIVRKLFAL